MHIHTTCQITLNEIILFKHEFYSLLPTDGILAYSMPQGDRRGSAYEFYDFSYDGEWSGNQLKNGLGCLTDGDYGPENFKLSYYDKSKCMHVYH